MIHVQFYTDYRRFLSDYLSDAQKRFSFFSYRYFCKKAGIKSPSLYREVVAGKRNLTQATAAAFVRGLGLGKEDAEFFFSLVRFNQAKKPSEKQQHLEILRQLRQRHTPRLVGNTRHQYYEHWYHLALRELACTLKWKNDYQLLAERICPPIRPAEARKSIELLCKLGFLKKKRDGSYYQSDPYITSGSETISLPVRNVNRQLAMLGVEAIDRFAPSERDISSMTIGISSECYLKIKDEIRDFRKRIARIVEDDTASSKVYNVNIQLFPLSATDKSRGGTG